MINEKYKEIKILTAQIEDKRKEALNGNEVRKDLNSALEIFDDIISTQNITKKQIASTEEKLKAEIIKKFITKEVIAQHIQIAGDETCGRGVFQLDWYHAVKEDV